MSAKSEAIAEINRQMRAIPEQLDIITKIHELEKASFEKLDANGARSTVLIAVGLLEHALSVALQSFFIDEKAIRQKIFDGDHEREGIIGTLYTRNIVAHALSIYGSATYSDINSIRLIRNLCAHAKSDIDLSAEQLTPLAKFHAPTEINAAFGFGKENPLPDKLKPQSPVHGMMQLLQHLIPYLLLHKSKDWNPNNRAQWRAIFS